MDEKLKIKISIADRVYPLTVEISQEEGLRSASKKIDVMIKQFEENFAKYVNSKYAVMVNSGSSANLIAVAALFFTKNPKLKLLNLFMYRTGLI